MAYVEDVCSGMSYSMSIPIRKHWSPVQVEELIKLYKKCSWLWDANSPHYKDKLRRYETFEKIGAKFRTTPEEVQTKIVNLKKHFNNEWRRCKDRRCNKPGFEDLPGSSWPHFHSLLFIKRALRQRLSEGNDFKIEKIEHGDEENLDEHILQSQILDQENNSGVQEMMLDDFCSSRNSMGEVGNLENEEHESEGALADSNTPMETAGYSEFYKDDYDIFGAFVAAELRAVRSDHLRRKLKVQIQKAILNLYEEDDEEQCDRPVNE